MICDKRRPAAVKHLSASEPTLNDQRNNNNNNNNNNFFLLINAGCDTNFCKITDLGFGIWDLGLATAAVENLGDISSILSGAHIRHFNHGLISKMHEFIFILLQHR